MDFGVRYFRTDKTSRTIGRINPHRHAVLHGARSAFEPFLVHILTPVYRIVEDDTIHDPGKCLLYAGFGAVESQLSRIAPYLPDVMPVHSRSQSGLIMFLNFGISERPEGDSESTDSRYSPILIKTEATFGRTTSIIKSSNIPQDLTRYKKTVSHLCFRIYYTQVP